MYRVYDYSFDGSSIGISEQPYQIFPTLHGDSRGWFQEVLKDAMVKRWSQINRSCSTANVVRGCHAQKGKFCQAKLVEAINEKIYDVITDCRPMSTSFGKSKLYVLDPELQNKLYVPHGFLHAFIVPSTTLGKAYFNYYCDRVYDKNSEIGVNPMQIVLAAISEYESMHNANLDVGNDLKFSDKDCNGLDFEEFKNNVIEAYAKNGEVWYND